MSEESPLVTFALFAYNQEALIADAMKAALAQDYSPLEIIVSDDCSSDGTWKVISEIAQNYDGPHHLDIVRNRSNLGIGPHVSAVGHRASGELIVMAAGDDLSVAERVSRIVDSWLLHGRPNGALHSATVVRRRDGNIVSKGAGSEPENATIDYFVNNHFRALFAGAAAAYTKTVFSHFPPLQAPFEDIALTFRSLLIGKVIYVDSVLVHYHVNDASVSRALKFSERARVKKWFETISKNVEGLEIDYAHYLLSTGTEPSTLITEELQRSKRRLKTIMGLGGVNPFRFLAAMLSYPYDVPFRTWVGFYLTFFGLR